MSPLNGRSQDARQPRMVGLACLCLVGVATTVLATTPRHGSESPSTAVTTSRGVEVSAAATVAREFLEDYLAWLSGHHRAQKIAGASSALRARLVAGRVRPSRARRRPQSIAELHTELTDADHGSATARVLGADTTLTITLTLLRSSSGWEVSDAKA